MRQLEIQLSTLPVSQQSHSESAAGVVYTRRWVVDLILDLAGYTGEKSLHTKVAVEPSFGHGAFLLPMIERLLQSARLHDVPASKLGPCIRGYELSDESVKKTRTLVANWLSRQEIAKRDVDALVSKWMLNDDYLLPNSLAVDADFVIGNPPYIRTEELPIASTNAYRAAFRTMIGRADVYVAFFEAALTQLKPDGACAFICADRWMRNQYGGALRQLITSKFAVETLIEMHDADAFESEVSAYPSISIIRRSCQGDVVVAKMGSNFAPEKSGEIASTVSAIRQGATRIDNAKKSVQITRLDSWFKGEAPWPCMSPEKIALLQRLEANFPALESASTGTQVGIGVATGADGVFITTDSQIVEESRLLPMAMAGDTNSGTVQWSGHYLVNPWDDAGLVDLAQYPRLAEYLHRNLEKLKGRHIAQKVPRNWYRTIDRVNLGLTNSPKLYIPDIRERLAPVLDDGKTYPHHNLYFVRSTHWDPEVLGGILMSEVCQFFIEAYSVRMRGGYLRFQAQYLRRIRVPELSAILSADALELKTGFQDRDQERLNKVVSRLYGLEKIPK